MGRKSFQARNVLTVRRWLSHLCVVLGIFHRFCLFQVLSWVHFPTKMWPQKCHLHCKVTQVKKMVRAWFSYSLLEKEALCFILYYNWDWAFEKLHVRAELFIVMSDIPEYMGKTQDNVSWYATDEKGVLCWQRWCLPIRDLCCFSSNIKQHVVFYDYLNNHIYNNAFCQQQTCSRRQKPNYICEFDWRRSQSVLRPCLRCSPEQNIT